MTSHEVACAENGVGPFHEKFQIFTVRSLEPLESREEQREEAISTRVAEKIVSDHWRKIPDDFALVELQVGEWIVVTCMEEAR